MGSGGSQSLWSPSYEAGAREGFRNRAQSYYLLILPDDTADMIGAAIDGETLRRK